jgi:hypothetical protein
MAGLRFAAVVVYLCLLLSSCSALRWLSDSQPESAAGQGHESYKTAYHFRPTENWQNGRDSRFFDSLRRCSIQIVDYSFVG